MPINHFVSENHMNYYGVELGAWGYLHHIDKIFEIGVPHHH